MKIYNSINIKEMSELRISSTTPIALFPGSFNPFHEGHNYIVQDCISRGETPVLEISVVTIDKPLIDMNEIMRRSRLIDEFYRKTNESIHGCMLVTGLPLLADKHKLFSENGFTNVTIVAGTDCLPRLATTNILSRLPFPLRIYNRYNNIEMVNTPSNILGISSTKLRNEHPNS